MNPDPVRLPPTRDGCCPVCRARFRGETECSRCGADLRPLMILLARAALLRSAARAALLGERFEEAADLAREAQEVRWTPGGAAIVALADWLRGSTNAPAQDTRPA